MLKYCLDQWNKNKERLEAALEKDENLDWCDYDHLVKLVVDNILNDETSVQRDALDSKKITVVDDGDYQGTLLFIIPFSCYQPCEYEYLMTYVNYGSCSGCDTLQSIHGEGEGITPRKLKGFMTLCKDLVTNMVKPYNCGWREDERFRTVEMEG